MNYQPLQPSDDFCSKTMAYIERLQHRKNLVRDLSLMAVALAPVVIRHYWCLMRSDYFSLDRLPFSNYLVSMYHVFLMRQTGYTFILLAMLLGGFYLMRMRRYVPAMRLTTR